MKYRNSLSAMALAIASFSNQAAEPVKPPFKATSISGETLPTGKSPIYLKFWATWCSYCLEEMPHLQGTYEHTKDTLEVISVNIGFNQNLGLVKRYMAKHDYTVPTIFDERGELVKKYNVTGTPTHILLDSQGKEVFRSALLTDELKQRLSALK
ncbi:TlpA family protein disulfide reductase [Pseudoalteromonas sp. S16_S37]|uniref:TlpA family protein disulfide reductase n=1 Tax=Pseudoalteromonas sp. S16_S37 TaxID=2720228 RepID=UPI0016812F73|nr:TlpA disulfide reductase family protein [Pseudoalteromonas sp. S16_S37]MBD1581866.1 TlpA family protein disulfide reductase [Pseudoalteromonas sp. S16_S37]